MKHPTGAPGTAAVTSPLAGAGGCSWHPLPALAALMDVRTRAELEGARSKVPRSRFHRCFSLEAKEAITAARTRFPGQAAVAVGRFGRCALALLFVPSSK